MMNQLGRKGVKRKKRLKRNMCSVSLYAIDLRSSSLRGANRWTTGAAIDLESRKANQILTCGEKGCAAYGRNGCLGGEVKYLESR